MTSYEQNIHYNHTLFSFIAGWIMIGLAQNKMMLFAGRILSCAFGCLNFSTLSVYITEIVHPDIRGSMVVLGPLYLASGYMLDWIIGYFRLHLLILHF